ncbi:hypothetical protein TNCV_4375411 [Trichonephila clavipes]|uniref:Uncharacterized protein n=1 Tax=Trichonephila clavipes TaxID=2585209 RepID=A0A8X6W213_TRICX|nr:hypothetical protein TNCV_4375411 [Trichonephila clavipes]
MRTWRNLGGRAKLTSFLETKLATILASLATMLASSEPSGIFQKVVDLSTSVTFNNTSSYISGSFGRTYKRRCSPVRRGVPPGQPIGVNDHFTKHPTREQPLSSQSCK